MKTFVTMAAQGDVVFKRIAELPKGVLAKADEDGKLVIAHSETGHHHFVDKAEARFYADPKDAMTCYLVVDGEYADIKHARLFDTHETLRVPTGIFQVRRQREYTPEGLRRVED